MPQKMKAQLGEEFAEAKKELAEVQANNVAELEALCESEWSIKKSERQLKADIEELSR